METRIVRIFNTYGPRMRPGDRRAVSNFIVHSLRGEPISIHGDGTQTRSFCYVDDLVEGIVRLFRCVRAAPTGIGNPREFAIRELAELVVEVTGSRSTLERLPLPEDDPKVCRPDTTVANEVLGRHSRVELEEGLRRTIPHFARLVEQGSTARIL